MEASPSRLGKCAPEAHALCNAIAASFPHPLVEPLCVVDDFRDCAIEAEKPVGKAQGVAGFGKRAHSPDNIGTAAPRYHVKRRRTELGEMLAKRVSHRAEGLVDIGVVRLAPDYDENIRLLQPIFVADAGDCLHLDVGWIAAKIGGNDCRFAEHFRHERIGAPAESGREESAFFIYDKDVVLALLSSE